MAAAKWPSPGLRNVGSYQISGHPFITGSTDLDNNKVHMVEFPYVCKSFTVINNNSNSGEDIRIHFQSGSETAVGRPGALGAQTIASTDDVIAGLHFITIPAGNSSLTMDARCNAIYISNGSGTNNLTYQVFAELTTIPIGSMYHLTGSGITDSE
tara:strand:+ start:338 stop:802 length:465 start_codon:yes stop_codon:yes gene_type:complete